MKANSLRVFVIQSRWSMLVIMALPNQDADNHPETPELENTDRLCYFARNEECAPSCNKRRVYCSIAGLS
jgi:hypothetical protein